MLAGTRPTSSTATGRRPARTTASASGWAGPTANMSEGLVVNAIYPPGTHCMGILVNAQGQRFINGDACVGRTTDAMLRRADGRCWIILDDEIHGPTQALHKVAAVENTIAELEAAWRSRRASCSTPRDVQPLRRGAGTRCSTRPRVPAPAR